MGKSEAYEKKSEKERRKEERKEKEKKEDRWILGEERRF